MADEENFEDELTYPQEDVDNIVNTTVEDVLGSEVWDELKVPRWINTICETLI